MVQRDFKVKGCVLILVLMEHAQSDCLRNYKRPSVLILILMEHAQKGDLVEIEIEPSTYVLILILMENAQKVSVSWTLFYVVSACLNPYFNGTCK